MTKVKILIKREIVTILLSLAFSLLAFLVLALIRLFDSKTFSFIQIILVTSLIGIVTYTFSFMSNGTFGKLLKNREIAITLIVFTLLSFSILNIDRSRSFYLTKWVHISQERGTTVDELVQKYDFSRQDYQDLLQRVEEQKQSGTIVESDGRLKLTSLGKIVVRISTLIAKVENLNGYPEK